MEADCLKTDILGVQVDNVTIEEAYQKLLSLLKEDKTSMIITPNSEILYAAYHDPELFAVLNRADMLIADGIGVVYASKILKKPLPERVAGFDLLSRVMEHAAEQNIKLFFLGAKPGVADAAKEKLKEKYPGIQIVGTNDGYFKDENDVIEKINNSGADLLLVCLGAPKQEFFMDRWKDKLKVKACIGAGGSLDVFAGTVKRAPEFFCKFGLEWFYRLIKEPWRLGRMMNLPKFILYVYHRRNKG